MATAVKQQWTPAHMKGISKPRERFLCDFCFREVEGWVYRVGFDSMHKVESCARCWAEPRIPPMKSIGVGVILG